MHRGRVSVGQGAVFRLDQGESERLRGQLAPQVRRRGAFLERLFEDEKTSEAEGRVSGSSAEMGLDALPRADDQDLRAKNAAKSDWISRNGAQDRSFKGQSVPAPRIGVPARPTPQPSL